MVINSENYILKNMQRFSLRNIASECFEKYNRREFNGTAVHLIFNS